jgi:hypothetical protein
LIDATGEPYSYAGGDPSNQTDPLGLSWIYIFIDRTTGLPYYVGRSETDATLSRRKLAHEYSGRFDPNVDLVEPFNLGDVPPAVTKEVEQATMSGLGTVERGYQGFNQRNEFRAFSSDKYAAEQRGSDFIRTLPRFREAMLRLSSRIIDNELGLTSRVAWYQREQALAFSSELPFGWEDPAAPDPTLDPIIPAQEAGFAWGPGSCSPLASI